MLALSNVEGLTGVSVVDVRGLGRSKDETAHVMADFVKFVEHVKIEVVCRDEVVDRVISTIENTAHTGLRGDGRIFVTNVEMAVHIETGARGEETV